MAIYKKPAEYKFASIRQGIFWALLGFIAGLYSLQPLMKATHREEKGYITKLIEGGEKKHNADDKNIQ